MRRFWSENRREEVIGREEWKFNKYIAYRIELCMCVFVCENVTLHPASSLSRHDGRRSFVWLLIVVVAVPMELATTFG